MAPGVSGPAAPLRPHPVDVVQRGGAPQAAHALPGAAPRDGAPGEGQAGVQSVRQQGAPFGEGRGRRGGGVQVLLDQSLRLRLHAALLRGDPELFQGDFLAVWLKPKCWQVIYCRVLTRNDIKNTTCVQSVKLPGDEDYSVPRRNEDEPQNISLP